jgi:hypothetical protein
MQQDEWRTFSGFAIGNGQLVDRYRLDSTHVNRLSA